MNPTDMLKHAISQRTAELIATIPADHDAATVALVRAIDEQPLTSPAIASPDPLTGIPVTGIGNSRALQLLLRAPVLQSAPEIDPDNWASIFLEACSDLARAELVLAHVETGFMRLESSADCQLEVRIAQRATPIRWQERADDAWWATWLSNQRQLPSSPDRSESTELFDRLAHRYDLPSESNLAEVDIVLSKRVLVELLAIAEHENAQTFHRHVLIARLADLTGAADDQVVSVIEALTLDATNATWHTAVPGIVDPPLVALPGGDLVVSRRGVCLDPFRFLTRELRRRDPDAYHSDRKSVV